MTLAAPCFAADRTARHCTFGFLLGVRCCPHGDCALCRATKDRLRRSGFDEAAVARSFARSRPGLLDRCPVCGFPPPEPLVALPPLPRLDRDGATKGVQTTCFCGNPIPRGRRRNCSPECRRESIRLFREGRLSRCSRATA